MAINSIDDLKNNPKAMKGFLNAPEDVQQEVLSHLGFGELKRSEQRNTLKTLIPGFADRPVKEQLAHLNRFSTPQMNKLTQNPSFRADVETGNAVPISGPITDVLVGGAMSKAPGIKELGEGVAAGAGKAGSFAERAMAALQSSPKAAGAAVGAVERATPSAVKAGSTLAEFPTQIPFTGQSVNALKTIEGQANYINTLEKAAARAETLPKEALNDFAKINDMIKDQLPGRLKARLFELDSKITGALNKALPARGEASQLMSDVMKKQKILELLKRGGKAALPYFAGGLGIGVGTGLLK